MATATKSRAVSIEQRMGVIGQIIRAELRRIRRRRPARAQSIADLIARLEAAGRAELEPLPLAPEFLSPVKHSPEFHASATPSCPALGGASTPSLMAPAKPPAPAPIVPIGRRADVAAALGVSLDWFDRNNGRLAREQAFPASLARPGQRKWAMPDITAWAATDSARRALRRARASHNLTKKMTRPRES